MFLRYSLWDDCDNNSEGETEDTANGDDEGGGQDNPDAFATLREMRRTGPLRELPEEAQAMLLGGTLFEYSSTAPALSAAEAQRAALAATLNGAWRTSAMDPCSTLTPLSATVTPMGRPPHGGDTGGEGGGGLASSPSAGETTGSFRGTGFRSFGRTTRAGRGYTSGAPSVPNFRQAVSRILVRTIEEEEGTPLNSTASEICETPSPTRLVQTLSRTINMLEENLDPDLLPDTPSAGGAEGFAGSMPSSPGALPSRGQSSASVATQRLEATRAVGSHEGTTSIADLDETALQTPINGLTLDAESPDWQGDLDRTELDRLLGHMTPAGGLDGGLIHLLRRLAMQGLDEVDEGVMRTTNRVLQLTSAISGQRLSDEEIRALPKVRFERAEEQSCSICLEPYQGGELLTALWCSHFFHVECLTRWFQRSTQCPLCRSQCRGS